MADGVEMETVDGTVKSVVFRNDETGFTILHVTPAATGTCAAAWEGEELHATGEWVDDPVRGRQFKAKSVECIPPKSVEGVRRYLASGLIRGIGPGRPTASAMRSAVAKPMPQMSRQRR